MNVNPLSVTMKNKNSYSVADSERGEREPFPPPPEKNLQKKCSNFAICSYFVFKNAHFTKVSLSINIIKTRLKL